ncbi:hypothetical protein FXB40_24430 [Bradyrhizobium rifense]|uniref:Uncharacterized protein n=1 Tax=Bradyrhizobium rifense TaxID=515499 RepID=A0A5D3KA00_9BRAD|nr:hypothetical protein FXB40_24430 [Bradyrhizobium rifense]
MAAVIDATVCGDAANQQQGEQAHEHRWKPDHPDQLPPNVFSSYFSSLRIESGRQVGEQRRKSTPSFRTSRSACPA